MTLRRTINKAEEKQSNIDARKNELKLISFTNLLIETSKYLTTNHSGYTYGFEPICDNKSRKNIGAYTGAVVIIVGDIIKNDYILKFIEILGGMGNMDSVCGIDNYWSCFKEFGTDYSNMNYATLKEVIDNLNTKHSQSYGDVGSAGVCLTSDTMKLNIIFWNLFLCALDDEIYNEQLPIVIELAHCLNLDEYILRDICRAVEYVLSGKKLSPNCDLQCDTIECAKFFLGKEE